MINCLWHNSATITQCHCQLRSNISFKMLSLCQFCIIHSSGSLWKHSKLSINLLIFCFFQFARSASSHPQISHINCSSNGLIKFFISILFLQNYQFTFKTIFTQSLCRRDEFLSFFCVTLWQGKVQLDQELDLNFHCNFS